MMKQDPFKEEPHLRTKLDEYHVDVPNFPMKLKRKRRERLISVLASPAKNPLEPFISTTNGFILLKMAPIAGTAALTLIQVLIFL